MSIHFVPGKKVSKNFVPGKKVSMNVLQYFKGD